MNTAEEILSIDREIIDIEARKTLLIQRKKELLGQLGSPSPVRALVLHYYLNRQNSLYLSEYGPYYEKVDEVERTIKEMFPRSSVKKDHIMGSDDCVWCLDIDWDVVLPIHSRE